MMVTKYPASWVLPVIVPKGADIRVMTEIERATVVEVSPLILGITAALLLLIPERALPISRSGRSSGGRATPPPAALQGVPMAYPKKSKGRRLFYMFRSYGGDPRERPKTIPRKKARSMIEALRRGGKSKGWLFAVWGKTADDARKQILAGKAATWPRAEARRVPPPTSGLSGDLVNCAVWQPVWDKKSGGEVWRCMVYAQSCAAGETLPPGGPMRTCAEKKKVYSERYGKMVDRCARFVKSKPAKYSCLPETMPTPDEPLLRNFDRKVRDVAEDMAADANKEVPWITREILNRGGIRSYKGGVEKEEYTAIPVHLRHRRGLPPDEMAAEMGMSSQELFRQIEKAYPKGRAKKKRRYTWEDFKDRAEGIVEQAELGPEGFRGVGQDLWIREMDMKKGAFTKQAKRAGMQTQEFADYVLSHPEEFRKTTRTRARLAKTFQKMAEGAYRQ